MSAVRPGVVYLVGAGPGDPGLMTARSLELIAAADAIFYDRLIPPGALDGAREDAELVYVGKAPGEPSVPQEEIGERLIEAGARGQERRAAQGRRPVRLRPRRRGGRSAARGRGRVRGRARGSPPASPPPPTPASRSPTATTPPRSPSSPATRTPRRSESALDWEALARFPGTLVFYMGVKRLAENAAALIDGRPRPRTSPPRRSNAARWTGQRTVVATLGTLAEAVEREGIERAGADRRRPGGRAARGARPGSSAGRCTAAASSSPAPAPRPAAWPATLRELGAEVVELPAIRIEPRIESDGGARRGRRGSATTRWSA